MTTLRYEPTLNMNLFILTRNTVDIYSALLCSVARQRYVRVNFSYEPGAPGNWSWPFCQTNAEEECALWKIVKVK